MPLRKLESDAEGRCRYGRSWRAVLLCDSDSAASIRKSRPEIKNRCTQEDLNGEKLASIRNSGLEIKNRCTLEGVNGEKLTSIPKFSPEIKNRCTQEGLNRENPASILKSGPKIKNRCMQQAIFSMRSLDEPLWRYVGGNLCERWFDSGGESGC